MKKQQHPQQQQPQLAAKSQHADFMNLNVNMNITNFNINYNFGQQKAEEATGTNGGRVWAAYFKSNDQIAKL